MKEFRPATNKGGSSSKRRKGGYAGSNDAGIVLLSEVEKESVSRISSGLGELDNVLGGGIVKGSVNLIGGDPGIGKSTLLIQVMTELSKNHKAIYITGEESLSQVSLRAKRLGLEDKFLHMYSETCVEEIIEKLSIFEPSVVVIDSIQTIYTEESNGAAGSVSQVRESAALLTKYAKQNDVTIFMVGHVTKEGGIAGPRVLEHIVDSVLYFEGETDSKYRLLRAIKNRFGSVNEVGFFAMLEKGLKEVKNPSAIFLNNKLEEVEGSQIVALKEGSRTVLVEVQSLVAESLAEKPRRLSIGIDHNRLGMIIALMSRYTDFKGIYKNDIYTNVVGGLKITETSSDVPVLLSLMSSFSGVPIPRDVVSFGEMGLSGEIRPVQEGSSRVQEAVKQGFKIALVPEGNYSGVKDIKGIKIYKLRKIQDIVDFFKSLS